MPAIPTFIERCERQRNEALSTIDAILSRAGDEDRDLNDTEEATLAEARTTLERADTQRGEYAEVLDRAAAGAELTNRMQGALARTGQASGVERVGPLHVDNPEDELRRMFRSPSDYVHTYVSARMGDHDAEQRLQRAVANQLVADNLGLVPTPILGPVVNLIAGARPTVSSVNNRPLPGAGRSFQRPVVAQHTAVGAQAAEKTELASQKMTINPINVNKQTYGGTLDISFQDRDWTDPAILQIVIDDMAVMYARQTDAGFVTAFVAAVTATHAIATPDGPGFIAAVAVASATIAQATGQMPDTMWVSPDMWAKIASLTDTTGRALFATIGAQNASGAVGASSYSGNVYGLRLIVDWFMPAQTIIVGIASLAEFYETIGGQLSVTEPSILGFLVAYYGYVAWCFPAPTAFVKLTGMPALPLGEDASATASAGK